jgi:hypothetical protein
MTSPNPPRETSQPLPARKQQRGKVVLLTRLASVFALVGLGLMVWSIVESTPISVIAAMSLGQAVGTLSLLLFLVAIVLDLRKAHVLEGGFKLPHKDRSE